MDGSQSLVPADIRRRRFTAADVQAMLDASVIKDGETLELIRGELIEISPKGPLYWDTTHLVSRWLRRNLPSNLDFATQGPFRLGEEDEPEAEFFVFPDGMRVNDVRGSDVQLAIEVAVSSLRTDLNVKSVVYAEHGVRQHWVVDVEAKRTLVHTLAAGRACGAPRAVAFDEALDAPGGARLVIADLAPKA